MSEKENMCSWVDIAIPCDGRVRGKEKKKLDKYEDLAIELQGVWQRKANVEPVVVGALGVVYK